MNPYNENEESYFLCHFPFTCLNYIFISVLKMVLYVRTVWLSCFCILLFHLAVTKGQWKLSVGYQIKFQIVQLTETSIAEFLQCLRAGICGKALLSCGLFWTPYSWVLKSSVLYCWLFHAERRSVCVVMIGLSHGMKTANNHLWKIKLPSFRF